MTTLRARLFRGHLLLLAGVFAAFMALTAFVTRQTLEYDADQLLRDKVLLLARNGDKANPERAYFAPGEKSAGDLPLIWQTRLPDGSPGLVSENKGELIPLTEAGARQLGGRDAPLLEDLHLADGRPVRAALCEVNFRGNRLFYAQVALPKAVLATRWHALLLQLAAGAGGILIVALVLLALWHGRWFRSLGLATESARRLAAASFSDERLAVAEDEPEIAALTTAFNQLLARIAHAQQSQRRFVADASHELRTPLTILRGEIDVILRRPRDSAEYEATLRSAREELERLSRLVENLLALAHADAGETVAVRELVDLAALAQTVADRFVTVAREKEILLLVDAPEPVGVRCDASALERAVSNLVENALRHTRGGEQESVTITCAAESAEAVVTVRDTGTGIGPEHLPQLFERFYRVDTARGRAQGGAGLGLSIVKAIIEAHGGTVGVASELGRGSVFTIRLPRVELEEDERAA